ncbi:MAG: hypothetical protein K1X38_06200 [Microthrixaceae bacterium]|nr:hypothetical protein [Microthrixaceae bacterium]
MRARHATPDHPTPPFDDVAGTLHLVDLLERAPRPALQIIWRRPGASVVELQAQR